VTDFSLEVFQNEYIPAHFTTMDAVLTVTAQGHTPAVAGAAAEVLIIDTSGSMYSPPGRIRAAIRAAELAVDRIRDGVLFGIVAGNHDASTIFPTWGTGLVVADPTTRALAREAVRHLEPSGGTAMSKWLFTARDMFATTRPASRRHAILLTDGENNEVPGVLDAALQQCRSLFQADCRGVGTDWVVGELRTIASALQGTVDIIREPDEVEAEFEALMEASMGRAAQATLRVRCPRGAAVSFVRQVAPDVEDLTGWGKEVDAHSWEYPLGAWGTEDRDYHLSVSVPGNEAGVEMLAARLSLVVPDAVVGPALVRVVWTDDDSVSTRVGPEVAHYSQQAELSVAIQHGLQALKAGDERTATVRLGQATRLAAASGHDGTVRLLRKVVDVEDERAGTVRIRRHVAKADEMELDTRSTRTVRVRKGDAATLDTGSSRTVRVGAAKEVRRPGAGAGTGTGGGTP
jgi:hypothetical protein